MLPWIPGRFDPPKMEAPFASKRSVIGENPKYPFALMVSQVSNEKNLGWLGYIGDHTTQLYRAL